MTQQPPTGQNSDPRQATPPSGWAPAPLSEGGRPSFGAAAGGQPDQNAPLGGPGLPQVRIEEYAPPKSRLPLLVVLIALAVAALIWAGTGLSAPSPTPSPSPTATPSASSAGDGLPFISTDGRLKGRWSVVQHRWTDSGLEAEIKIAADRGPVRYKFAAFGNDALRTTPAQDGNQDPHFSNEPLPSGQSESGWLFFALERGPSTIFLYDGRGSQMSALTVEG